MSFYDDASLIMYPSGYKADKIYSLKPTDGSGDFDFARSNDTATRVNSDGLIEKVRTNLVLQSQDFTTTWGAVDTSVTANTTANPLDGAVNADTITFGAGTTQKFVAQAISLNGNYTISVYLKAGTHQFAQILLGTDPTPFANFDLVNGTASASGSTATIVSAGNGWYRCSIAFSTSTGNSVFILASDSLATSRFQITSSTGTLIAFGYQLETGDIATDYIPTTTTAVSVGMTADVPRIDYSNGCGKLLLEPQRTNLLTYSEQFDDADWEKAYCNVTANSAIAPDGTLTADKLVIVDGIGPDFGFDTGVKQNKNIPSDTYTYSVYAKAAEFTGLRFRERITTGDFIEFDLSTGIAPAGSGTFINPQMVDFGDGWYKCSFQSESNMNNPNKYALRVGGTGDGTSGIYIWGAQLEEGAYPTSYIPTLSAASTRGADDCEKTGISSLIGQTEGTLFLEFEYTYNDSLQVLIKANQITDDNSVGIELSYSSIRALVRSGTSAVADISETISFGKIKAAIAYKSNDFAFYVNGVQAGTDTSGTISWEGVVDMLTIGKFNLGGADYFRSSRPFNQALLFKTRLTNTQLEELTTI